MQNLVQKIDEQRGAVRGVLDGDGALHGPRVRCGRAAHEGVHPAHGVAKQFFEGRCAYEETYVRGVLGDFIHSARPRAISMPRRSTALQSVKS